MSSGAYTHRVNSNRDVNLILVSSEEKLEKFEINGHFISSMSIAI